MSTKKIGTKNCEMGSTSLSRVRSPRDVKTHEPQARARVARLHPDDGYGFLETPDGREIYFHCNSVVGGEFEQFQVGDEVRFAEELGDRGPQASTVHPASVRPGR